MVVEGCAEVEFRFGTALSFCLRGVRLDVIWSDMAYASTQKTAFSCSSAGIVTSVG